MFSHCLYLLQVDGSGKCSITYTTKDNTITKVKDLTSCQRSATTEEYSHHKKIIGVTVQSDSQTTFELSDDKNIIQSALSTENYSTYVNIRHDLSSSVQSRQVILSEISFAGGWNAGCMTWFKVHSYYTSIALCCRNAHSCDVTALWFRTKIESVLTWNVVKLRWLVAMLRWLAAEM